MKYHKGIIALIVAMAIMALFAGCISQTDSGQTESPSAEETDAGSVPLSTASKNTAPAGKTTYTIVDTGQTKFFNNIEDITCPAEGEAFYGQDARFSGNQPAYEVSSDGLTVYDEITGLTWQKSPDTNGDGSITADDKLTLEEAKTYPDELNQVKYGGFSDWRLPTIKEQYSLIDFSGTDPSGVEGTDTSGLTPFIDTDYFSFEYGETDAGERIIDSQYASDTLYVYEDSLLFGVNFADGRIKGYGLTMPGPSGDLSSGSMTESDEIPSVNGENQMQEQSGQTGSMPPQGGMPPMDENSQMRGQPGQSGTMPSQGGMPPINGDSQMTEQSGDMPSQSEGPQMSENTQITDNSGSNDKTFFVTCVRGNPDYGINDFSDNGDGTVTDSATGLTWTKSDSGTGMNWKEALTWVQTRNSENYLGYSDWRLPNIKELQSIVDYSRSPDTSDSAAIDPVFECTDITNEAGEKDYPYFWSSTTHETSNGYGGSACYVSFGRAMGYMDEWQDVHGAGAQRSDPKAGDASEYPEGYGPQGDAIRIYNFVRLVR